MTRRDHGDRGGGARVRLRVPDRQVAMMFAICVHGSVSLPLKGVAHRLDTVLAGRYETFDEAEAVMKRLNDVKRGVWLRRSIIETDTKDMQHFYVPVAV